MLPVALAWSSDDIVTSYLFPVLWMTSCFVSWGQWARTKHDVVLKGVRRVAVPVIRQQPQCLVVDSSECGSVGRSLLSTIDLLLRALCARLGCV